MIHNNGKQHISTSSLSKNEAWEKKLNADSRQFISAVPQQVAWHFGNIITKLNAQVSLSRCFSFSLKHKALSLAPRALRELWGRPPHTADYSLEIEQEREREVH